MIGLVVYYNFVDIFGRSFKGYEIIGRVWEYGKFGSS